jgi:hypothetical protein
LRSLRLSILELLGPLLVYGNGLYERVVWVLSNTLLNLQVGLLCVWTRRAELPDKLVDGAPIAIHDLLNPAVTGLHFLLKFRILAGKYGWLRDRDIAVGVDRVNRRLPTESLNDSLTIAIRHRRGLEAIQGPVGSPTATIPR